MAKNSTLTESGYRDILGRWIPIEPEGPRSGVDQSSNIVRANCYTSNSTSTTTDISVSDISARDISTADIVTLSKAVSSNSILQLIDTGLSFSQTAKRLGISKNRVNNTVQRRKAKRDKQAIEAHMESEGFNVEIEKENARRERAKAGYQKRHCAFHYCSFADYKNNLKCVDGEEYEPTWMDIIKREMKAGRPWNKTKFATVQLALEYIETETAHWTKRKEGIEVN